MSSSERLVPYDLLLPDDEFAERVFPGIVEEAAQRGTDLWNPAAFAILGGVQGALAELRDPDAPAESAQDLAGPLFFACHYWRRAKKCGSGDESGGSPPELFAPAGPDDLRSAAGSNWSAPGDAAFESWRGKAGYLQLPRHLVWAEGEEPPESVDGFFWAASRQDALNLLMIAGIRRDRPGFSAIAMDPQLLASIPGWASAPARQGGKDFASSLPGAELSGLVGLRTHAEAIKLSVRLLWSRAARSIGGSR